MVQHSLEILKSVKGIGTIFLDEKDVIRHKLVQSIIKAYKQEQLNENGKNNSKN